MSLLTPSLDKAIEAIFGPLDPATEFRYYVEVDGLWVGSFVECSGIRAQREIVEIREGGVNDYVHKLPGRASYSNISLRKGIVFSTDLWDWFETGLSDLHVKKRDMTVIMYSSYFNIPARWYEISDAYPASWSASDLRADGNGIAFESLELSFRKLKVDDWSLLGLIGRFLI